MKTAIVLGAATAVLSAAYQALLATFRHMMNVPGSLVYSLPGPGR